MIKKEEVIEALDRFTGQQRARLSATLAEEDYELVSFRSGYVEGLEMAKAIVLLAKEATSPGPEEPPLFTHQI